MSKEQSPIVGWYYLLQCSAVRDTTPFLDSLFMCFNHQAMDKNSLFLIGVHTFPQGVNSVIRQV